MERLFGKNKRRTFTIACIIAVIGGLLFTIQLVREAHTTQTRAANASKLEIENGVLAGNATLQIDSSASGNAYVAMGQLNFIQRFLPPVTTRTITVPSSVDATGTTNVQAAIQTIITSAPNGSVIQFPSGGTYRADTRLQIYGKTNIIIDGGGSRIKNGTTNHTQNESTFDVYNSTNITLRNFIIEGGSPKPGILIDGTQDQAHGVNIYEASKIEMDHLTFEKIWGDPFQVDGDVWPQGIWMHDCTITSAGRSGFSVLAARDVWFERNTVGQVGLHAFNIEPWQATGGGINVNALSNTVGSYGHGDGFEDFGLMFAAEGTAGSTVTDVTISGNKVTGKSLQTQITQLPRRQRITITNNISLVPSAPYFGAPGVLTLAHIDGLTINGNVQPLTSGIFASIVDSTGVTYQP